MKADGPGARPGAKVALLDGAYFDAGPTLQSDQGRVTVFLRARDPRGQWNAALFAKRGGADRLHFNLFSTALPEASGAEIGFEVETDQGMARTSFPVSQIAADAWHDLVGRYDGQALGLFCDGQLRASKPHHGVLQKNHEPLLIGAESEGGKITRHFRGELEDAALWSRALSDEEIRILTLH